MTIDISYSPAQPIAGQEVTITYTANDPDGFITSDCWSRVETGIRGMGCAPGCAAAAARYGPWTPPSPEPGRSERIMTETYPAGTFTLAATVGPVCGSAYAPYASTGSADVQIVVQPA